MNVVHMVQADVQTTHRCTTAVNNMHEMKHCDHFDMSCSDLDCDWDLPPCFASFSCMQFSDDHVQYCNAIQQPVRDDAGSAIDSTIVIDTGADVSVAPMWCMGIGDFSSGGIESKSELQDASENVMENAAVKKRVIRLEDSCGRLCEFADQFVISSVKQPILAGSSLDCTKSSK